MQVYFQKEIQVFEYVSFTELKIENKSNSCCEKFVLPVILSPNFYLKLERTILPEKWKTSVTTRFNYDIDKLKI